MAEYDGLPLNTPTVVEDTADYQKIATRTATGGEVRIVAKAGSPGANVSTLQNQVDTALASLRTYIALASPTAAQTTAQTKAQAQILIGLIRLIRNQLDATT